PREAPAQGRWGAKGRRGGAGSPPTNGVPSPTGDTAPVSILNDWLWHGQVGVGRACTVFTDPELLNQTNGQLACTPPPGRTVTKVDANVSTFTDADGVRGAGWVKYPTDPPGGDGLGTILHRR